MRPSKSLRHKFFRTLLFVTALGGVATLGIVVFLSAQTSARQLASVQHYIEEGISSKGRVLTENHALALRGLTVDNAFLDIRSLVERGVQEDQDVLYGLYVVSERETLAFSRHGRPLSADQSPAGDAWRALELTKAELLVTRTTLSHPIRLGERVLEVAAPVRDDSGELLGTVRYGLSTQRMQQALTQARAESEQRLRRSLLVVGGLIALTSMIGLLLSRAQAHRITKPVAELTHAAQTLAKGDRSVHVAIDSGDELELLGASFNHMVRDLDASYRRLEEMNRTLERKVEERTTELAQKNRDMRLVLDNVDQGFVTLGMDGKIALERSRVVDDWFGSYAEPVPIWDYLGKSADEFGSTFQLGWEQVVDGLLPVDAALAQLPDRLAHGLRTFSLRYLPFYKQNGLDGILVVIADITERLAREREEAEQSDLMQAFKKLMLDRSGFSSFLRDGTETIESICTRRLDGDVVTLKRAIHTLKGNSASMGLAVVARLCHELEEELAEHTRLTDAKLAELHGSWWSLNEQIAKFVALSNQRVIEVPEPEYASLIARLSTGFPRHPELLQQVQSWQLEPVSRPFCRLAEQAKALARRLGKGEVATIVESGGVRLDSESWSPFFAELVHVIRNAVDHGLESPDERERLGKPLAGTLILKAERSENVLTFEIGDDGRGIDWEGIASRAKARGLPHRTREELVSALCADGITTRLQATTASGRGVGMAAVRQRVESMNGRLELRSIPGAGTTFIARFPWSAHDASTGKARGAGAAAQAVAG
jgi:HPt (histidine-containing phosphotransfer) domain-containing protein/HAMP domain-containing protein